jgi:hypothetical protein
MGMMNKGFKTGRLQGRMLFGGRWSTAVLHARKRRGSTNGRHASGRRGCACNGF